MLVALLSWLYFRCEKTLSKILNQDRKVLIKSYLKTDRYSFSAVEDIFGEV